MVALPVRRWFDCGQLTVSPSARIGKGGIRERSALPACAPCGEYKCVTVQVIMASRSVNKVILVGNLGKDAETKFTPSGTAVTKFPIATGRRWKDQQSGEWKEETDWHNVILWRSENLANYLLKGKQ